MALTNKDIRKIERQYDIAIYNIQWWEPRQGSANEYKRKTEKGVGFMKWCRQMSEYWLGKK